jgi:hypothetical protein
VPFFSFKFAFVSDTDIHGSSLTPTAFYTCSKPSPKVAIVAHGQVAWNIQCHCRFSLGRDQSYLHTITTCTTGDNDNDHDMPADGHHLVPFVFMVGILASVLTPVMQKRHGWYV